MSDFTYSTKYKAPGILSVILLTFFLSLIVNLVVASVVEGKNVTLKWDVNDDADYYVVYWGNSSGNYNQQSANIISSDTEYTVEDLSELSTWYFAVKAFNSFGNSSDYSDEIISEAASSLNCLIENPSSVQSIMAGSSINFQGLTNGGSGTLTYLWDFGGSGTDNMTVEDPGSVIFENAGVFTVTFTVTDGNNTVVSDTVQINVASDTVPLASITSPSTEQSIMEGATINFQGNASGGNGTLVYSWNFGGSGTSNKTVEDPGNITFFNAGTYTITFSVTDEDGDVVSDTVKVNVASDTIPTGIISNPSTEQSIMAGSTINFQGSATGGNGTLTYSWDFGGSGTSPKTVEDPGNITFLNAGTYTITFSVTDEDGDVVFDTVKINVASDTIPSASIASPLTEKSIMEGSSINFQGNAAGGNGTLTYTWDFDGGAVVKTVEDPGNVVFNNAGTFDVTFKVTDSDGDMVSDSVKINVASDTIPSSVITSPLTEQFIMAGKSINFQGSSSGGNAPLTYHWDFDGGAAEVTIEDPGYVTFNTPGTYEVAFTVTDSDGNVVLSTITVNVASDSIPTASITNPSNDIEIMSGGIVSFQGSASGGNAPLTYHWDFEDAVSPVSVQSPGNIEFLYAGTYVVTFSVTDSDGDVASDTVRITVENDTIPNATIVQPESQVTINKGETLTFNGEVMGGNAPVSFSWDFAGVISQSQNEDPGSVVFSNPGTYTIIFSVTDADGDVDTDSVEIVVTDTEVNTDTPEPVYPSEENEVSLTPELQADITETSGYSRWQISTDTAFSNIIIDVVKKDDLSYLQVPRLVLDFGTTYFWRVSKVSKRNDTSIWSETSAFTTISDVTTDDNSTDDQDIDGTVDIDSDGVADISQDDIICVRNIIKDSHIIGVKKGTNVEQIQLVESIDHREIDDTAGMPDEMPEGLIGFKVLVNNPGATVEVIVYFTEPAPENAGWYKYDSVNGWIDYTSWVTFSSNRKSVTITLTDGGLGDADGIENGVIVDPGGLGLTSQSLSTDFSELASEKGCFIDSGRSVNDKRVEVLREYKVIFALLILSIGILIRVYRLV